MRRLALLAALLAGLAVAPPAVAKHLRSVTACGDAGCLTSQDRHLLAAFVDVGPPTDPPSAPKPFYLVTVRMEADGHATRAVPAAPARGGLPVAPLVGAAAAALLAALWLWRRRGARDDRREDIGERRGAKLL